MVIMAYPSGYAKYHNSVGGNKKEKITPMEKEESSILDTSLLHLDISIT